jgi:hypothetical protein
MKMNASNPRDEILWRDGFVHGVGFSPTIPGNCYIVLSRDAFGWEPAESPVDHPLWWPSEYYIIPLDDIHHVEVRCENFTSGQGLQIFWDEGEPEFRVFTVNINFAHRWVAALQWLGIPVYGAEAVALHTWRGFVNNYGWYLWFILIMVGFFVIVVISFRINPTYTVPAMLIYLALIPILNVILLIWMNLRPRQ